MNQFLLWLALVAVAMPTQENESNETERFTATGTWKVVSQTSGPSVLAVPDNKIFLSGDLFAEYDRINNPKRTIISLYNVRWKGEGATYSTPLYRSPAKSLGIDRFAEDNVTAFCYLQIRTDSAVMLISEARIDRDQFASNGPASILDANARMMTLMRVGDNPKSRATHLAAHADMVMGAIGGEMLHYRLNRTIGGFLDENKASATKN